jgi:TPP-dependent pyruvate/acetoin dehydrogenase alpha subunit
MFPRGVKKKDPIIKMENYLVSNNVSSQKDLDISKINSGMGRLRV